MTLRFFIKAVSESTWWELPTLLIKASRYMNSQVGTAEITIANPNAQLDATFASAFGYDVQITDIDGTTVVWQGILLNWADINRETLQIACAGYAIELKRRRYSGNYIIANGISTAVSGADLTDAQNAFTVDALINKGLLIMPAAQAITDTVRTEDKNDTAHFDGTNLWATGKTSGAGCRAYIGHIHPKDYNGYFRFKINVPKGASISAVTLRLTAFSAAAFMDDDVITEIYLVDGSTYNDDYPLFRDWATTEPTEDAGVAHVDWTIQADTVGIVDSPDIDSLVIHYIQHPNYQPGKHLAIKVKNLETDNYYKDFTGGMDAANTKNPQLIITYTTNRGGKWYTIDDNTATMITCTGDNLATDGAAVDDMYFIGELDSTICTAIINNMPTLTASVKAATSYTAAYFSERTAWDLLMDYQLKLNYDIWESLDASHTLNFTDTHAASGFTLTTSSGYTSIRKLYNTDEYYTAVHVIGCRHSPIFTATTVEERYLTATGNFTPGTLTGRAIAVLTNTSVGASAIGKRYEIIGNTETRIIVEKDATMKTDGFDATDKFVIIDGAELRYTGLTQDYYRLGKTFLLEDPGILTMGEATTYATQILATFGAYPIRPLIIFKMERRVIGLDVGTTCTVTIDELSAETYVCIRVEYIETQGNFEVEYWIVKE